MTKKKGNRNALVHGLYSKDILLPWDSKDEFEKLHQDLRKEFSPCGRAEEECVLDLAYAHHLKHTLWRMRQSAVLQDPFTKDILDTGCKTWRGMRREMRAKARSDDTLINLARDAVSIVRTQMLELQPETITKLGDQMDVCLRTLEERIVPLLQVAMQMPDAEKTFDRFYAPENLEKIIRLEAMNDARIAKLLSRLVGLKEFKRTPAGGGVPPMLENRA